VQQELDRIKEVLSPQKDGNRQVKKLPANGTRVVLTGLANGSNYNGREAVVVERDGGERVMVQVCGASELCQLSVKLENMAIMEQPDAGEGSYNNSRDFSRIHELATLHAQQNAKREVERLDAEADEQRHIMEHAARADSLTNSQRTMGAEASLSNRQRCRHGNKCGKPDCMDLHPWEADWVESGARSGCDSKSKFKAAKGIYNLHTPSSRFRSNLLQHHHKPKITSPSGSPNRGKDSQMAEAAVEIDRILAQAWVPVAARQAAHANVMPLLCCHGTVGHSMPAHRRVATAGQVHTQAGKKLGQGRLGGVRAGGGVEAQKRSTHDTLGHRVPCDMQPRTQGQPPKSLHELQRMQQSLQRSLDGIDEDEQGTVVMHVAPLPMVAPYPFAAKIDDGEGVPARELTWRDFEDPEIRRQRIMQLVEIKRAELRKKKLVHENALLQEALVACGAALKEPLPTPSPDKRHLKTRHLQSINEDTKQFSEDAPGPAPIQVAAGRPHVRLDDDTDTLLE